MNLRLVAATSVALAGLALSSCSVTSNTAVSVGDESISVRELEDHVEAIAVLDPESWIAESGAVSGDFGRLLATTWARGQISRDILDQIGDSVTDEDRAATQDGLEQDPALSKADEETMTFLVDSLSPGTALDRAATENPDLAASLQDQIAGIEVDVNSRYGVWDSTQFAVVPVG